MGGSGPPGTGIGPSRGQRQREEIMGQATGQPARSARCIALVGPYLSGKPTSPEATRARPGASPGQGTMAAKNTVGDASDEARHHGMSVELNAATVDFM